MKRNADGWSVDLLARYRETHDEYGYPLPYSREQFEAWRRRDRRAVWRFVRRMIGVLAVVGFVAGWCARAVTP